MQRAGKIIFLLIIILTISLRVIYIMGPVDRNAKNGVQLIIESGTSGREIANKLYEKKLIRSRLIFNILISVKGMENSLKAGIYDIKASYDMEEIIALLVEGRVATFRVTIPEGFTIEEIASRLAVLTPYSEKEYISYAKQDMGRKYVEEDENIKYLLEGFLYPDTYVIPKEYSPEDIYEVMLSVFEERYLNVINNAVTSFSTQEIMTIASMVEKEARLDKEKPIVAAVIYNRLKRNMLLQIDACIQYIMKDRKDRVLYSDLEIDSPYNTYIHRGLPPGPISNPGASSIEAALNPADVDYLFYFAKKDGSHVFSHSYREHLRLQNEMRDN